MNSDYVSTNHHFCLCGTGVPYSDASMRAQPYLDSSGNILNEAAYRDKRSVAKLGHHVLKNATWVLPHFNCLVQVRYNTM